MAWCESGIATKKSPGEYEQIFNDVIGDITQAYEILAKAHKRFDDAFCVSGSDGLPLPNRYEGVNYVGSGYDQVTKRLNRVAWQHLLEVMGVRKLMTRDQWEAVYDRLQKNMIDPQTPLPPLTGVEIVNVYQTFIQNAPNILMDGIKKIYEYLTPGRWDQEYKTNKPYLSNKVIIERGVSDRGKLTQHSSPMIVETDRVFHALDGNMEDFYKSDSYVSDLADGINTSPQGETDYFRWKRYKNQNLHLQFKRMDLVEEFNRIVADQTILSEVTLT